MIRQSIARRYAKGLFAVGVKDGKYREYLGQLDEILGVFSAEPKIKAALMMPLLEMERRRDILSDLAQAMDLSPAVTALMNLLLENNRVNYLPMMRETYEDMANAKEGIVKGIAYSAFPVSDDTKSRVEEALGTRLDKKVHLTVQEDVDLIGGMKVIIGGTLIDGSVKRQLELLNESMMKE